MAGDNTGFNTDKIIRLMTIGIIATLFLALAVGSLYIIQNFFPKSQEDITPTGNIEYIPSDAYYRPEYSNSDSPAVSDITNPDANHAGEKDTATVIEPFTPDDPYYFSSAARFNTKTPPEQTILKEEQTFQTLYQNNFDMIYTALSIKATAAKGPLLIEYTVSNSIGSSLNPAYSFLVINVTDYNTGENVASGGYAREYCSETTQSIKVLQAGDFRIDIYGNGISLDLKVKSGAEPGQTTDAPQKQSPVENYPEEEWW